MTLTSPSKYRNPVLAGVVFALIVLGVGAAVVLWSGYVREVEGAKTRADRFTRLLEEHTLRNIQAVDLVLQIVFDASPNELSDHDPEIEDWLRRRLKDLPHVRALFTIGPDCIITQHSDRPNEPRVTLADRNDLIYREQKVRSGLHIVPALYSKSVNRWVLPVSRQIGAQDENGGIVVAAVDPSFYERFYSQLSLGEEDAISLWHADGTLIARVPQDYGLVGEKVPWAPVVSGRPEESAGTFIRSDPFNADEQWVVSYRAVPGMPSVVTTSLSLTAAVDTWRQIVLLASISFILLAGLAIATPVLIFKRIREQEEAHHRTIVLQKFDALGRMTGGIAHDFNNVLAAIESGLHLLSRNVHDPEKAEAYATAMKDALGRGTRLTAQLLGFAKRQDPEVRPADANKLLKELEPMLRHATGPGTRVVLEQAPGLPLCRIDETQFDAAILNLVMNARDAMPQGGQVTIETELSVQQTRRADDGPSHGGASAKAVLLCRSIAAVGLLVLTSAAAQADPIPLPREKPGPATEEDGDVALSSSCLRALEQTGVVAKLATGYEIRGECTMEDSVAVEAVEASTGTVTLPGRPILQCQFAAVLGAWLGEVVSPVADSLLGSPVDAIITGPGYQCRRRADGRLSEHASGNAVDLAEVRLADGRQIPIERLVEAEGVEQQFLRAISASACGYFTTVLGPGSDAAHARHLHLDLAERRIAEFRICMPR